MQPWIRIAVAGLLGGVVMFLWASIAHLATPLPSLGIGQIPNEDAVLERLHASLARNDGLYMFPTLGEGADAMAAYETKLKTSPSGLLIYHPPGAAGMEARQLATEFASELAQSLIAAALLAWAAVTGYWLRVSFVSLVGIAAGLTTNVSYWNWYGFPADYTLGYAATEMIGYVAAGLVIAAILPRNTGNGLWRVTETNVTVAIGDMG